MAVVREVHIFQNVTVKPYHIFLKIKEKKATAHNGVRLDGDDLIWQDFSGSSPEKSKGVTLNNVTPFDFYWCLGRESNSYSREDRGILSPLRLPVPPPRHILVKCLLSRFIPFLVEKFNVRFCRYLSKQSYAFRTVLFEGIKPLLGGFHLVALRVFFKQLIVDNFGGLIVFQFFKGQPLLKECGRGLAIAWIVGDHLLIF